MIQRVLLLGILSLSCLAHAQEAATCEIDSEQSWIRMLVYSGGLLSGLGHNHVISSHEVEGTLLHAIPVSDSEFTIRFPVATLVIDEPAIREIEGDDFPGKISEKDKDSTRRNMLGKKLLDSENYPEISVRSTAISGKMDDLQVMADIIIRDHTANVSFVATAAAADNMEISGTTTVSHENLGLTPFSAAFGLVRVREDITIRFHFVTRRCTIDGN